MSEWDAFPVASQAARGGSEWDAFPAASAKPPGTLQDIAKSLPADALSSVAGALGGGGDLRQIGTALQSKLPTALQPAAGVIGHAAANLLPGGDLLTRFGPSSGQIESAAQNVTGPLYQPQTTGGKIAKTVAEFAPAMIGGPEGLAQKFATRALIPGAASELAGEATQGTAAEPYARVGAAVLGGASSLLKGGKAVPKLNPQDAIDTGAAAFKNPDVLAVQIKPSMVDGVANIITSDLNRSRLNERLAPQTHAIIDDLRNPVGGANHTIEDFQTARVLLEKQAGNFANPTEQAAASKAIKSLDLNLKNLPQSALVSGDIKKANAILEAGRGDYAAGKAAQRIQEKLNNAELQAASAHSGGNIDNATRQKLRTVLTSQKNARGLTPEELDQIDQVVRGSSAGNALRGVGKLLGGGGGLGALASAGAGAAAAGPAGIVTPLVGYGIKKIGDALTKRSANSVVQNILSRAPSAPPPLPPASIMATLAPAVRNALISAYLSQSQSQLSFAPKVDQAR